MIKRQRHYHIEVGRPTRISATLVGCGGTGSFLALHLSRLAYHLKQRGCVLDLILIDFDQVETKNIGRQYFCHADTGKNKAAVLASRLSRAYGLPIRFSTKPFTDLPINTYQYDFYDLNLLIGAVDNHQARRSLATVALKHKKIWWLDCGNEYHSGQVLLGNGKEQTISNLDFCTSLPIPSIQSPDLLEPDPQTEQADSCAELMQREAQSLNVNSFIATLATEYITQLIGNKLTRYATYFDLAYGNMRSEYITKN